MTILIDKEEAPALHKKQEVNIDDLRYQVEVFMKGGGKIQQIPQGRCTYDMTKKSSPQEFFTINSRKARS